MLNNWWLFSLGQYTVPSISGQCCLPTDGFIIEKVNHSKGIMFGGVVTTGNIDTATNNVYIFNVTHNTIVSIQWYIISCYSMLYCIVLSDMSNMYIDGIMHIWFVYVSSIGRVLNQEQYLVKDCGLRGDKLMLVLLSLVTLPHLH